ncbi:hypothetical protein EW146_g5812 [Bondarzewia mesenterica]|uniref:Uncharacterized protein n=1 Tax=Bondarzewia mesenterica TaxID=1095465 RepID=A0A4S4LRD3_9AGAM|nr:hypothetical protein EW146_g5812 [Bondarzewia mesenterica]
MSATPGSSSTMSSPSNDQSLTARALLDTADFNLNESALYGKLTWFRDKQGDVLILRPTDNDDRHSSPTSATLGCIVDIDYDNYWLTSDGHYTGGGNYPQSFDKTKPTCYVKQPTNPALMNEFTNVIQNLRYLQDLMEPKAKSNDRSGYLVNDKSTRFKVRHPLFTNLKEITEEEKRESTSLRHELTTAGWPVETDAAKRQLDTVQTTHRVVPLPAYDIDGDLISPTIYRNMLAGATVALCIRLLHYTIKKTIPNGPTTYTDSFVADIEKIRVITAPVTVTSKKRPLALKDSTPPSERSFGKRPKTT